MKARILGLGVGLSMTFAAAAEPVGATGSTADLPEYRATQGVSGTLKSIGSDTMNNVMTHWQESFQKFYPSVRIQIEGKGSSTAPAALIEGQAQFGPMSREMKAKEIDDFEKKFGYKPTGLRTAIDCLAVYVNKDCPLEVLTLDQVRDIFSVTGGDLTWDQIGVTDPRFRGKPISLYGRDSSSGTYGYFKEFALGGKDFKATVKEQRGSSSVVSAVAGELFAMGYSGIGYKTADVKAIKIGTTRADAAAPSIANAYSGEYPLARFLIVYVNHDPSKPLDPLRAEFIRMIFSRVGQEGVVKDGFIPVPAEIAAEELVKVGLK